MRQLALLAIVALAAAACAAPGPTNGPGGAGATQVPVTQAPGGSPAPGDSSAPDASLAPAAAGFKPISLSGKGDKVAKFTIPEDQGAIAIVSAKGKDNFAITSLDSGGKENDLLVNTIGSYSGTVLFDMNDGEHSIAFKIEAAGFTWSIKIEPLSSAKVWSGAAKIAGKGDNVLQLSPASSGLTTLNAIGSGKDNFVVTSYATDGSYDLLVNEIGHYSGQIPLRDGSNLIAIEADGSWSLTLDK